MAWWESTFELSTVSAVSGQLHQHLIWTRGKEWFCLLGMSEGPDNYIWQSHKEWLCNVIAKNCPFNSISGCQSFLDEWHFISAIAFLFSGLVPSWASCSSLPLLWYQFVFSLVFFLPGPTSPSPSSCTHSSFHSPLVWSGSMCECARGECWPKGTIFSFWSRQASVSALTHQSMDDLLPCYACYFCVSGTQKT